MTAGPKLALSNPNSSPNLNASPNCPVSAYLPHTKGISRPIRRARTTETHPKQTLQMAVMVLLRPGHQAHY